MALVHPGRTRALSYDRRASAAKPLHPAVGLLAGFAILIGVAMLVHTVFGLLL